eukprot:Plantae.Rhodophyta-Hildenbrandia_rubra.ctg18664.p1 GENE.Plantae.Rhodophyta-Hildenbrandia_rubra.ctg18664~~Plantae.Rhodophyta-Hildenbrandia_rubra.ctg18664.p1  ORF type:complete len:993 (-),score=219.05 Plantae.Rhodophyta-Hildenbrandia_rubra.ctg18664:948-3926(-)
MENVNQNDDVKVHREDFVQIKATKEYAIVERVGDDAEIESEEFFSNHYFDDGQEEEMSQRAQIAPWEDVRMSETVEIPDHDKEVTKWQRVRPGWALVFIVESEKRFVRKCEELKLIQRQFCPGSYVMKRGGKQYGVVVDIDKVIAVVACSIDKDTEEHREMLQRTYGDESFDLLPSVAKVVSASKFRTYPQHFTDRYFVYRNKWLVHTDSDVIYLRVALLDHSKPDDSPAVCLIDAVENNVVPLKWGAKTPYTLGTFYEGQTIRADEDVWKSAFFFSGSFTEGVSEGVLLEVVINEIAGQLIAAKDDSKRIPDLSSISPDGLTRVHQRDVQSRVGAGDIGLVYKSVFLASGAADERVRNPEQEVAQAIDTEPTMESMQVNAIDGNEQEAEDEEMDEEMDDEEYVSPAYGLLLEAQRKYNRISQLYHSKDVALSNEVPVRVAAVKSSVKVQWQDGTVSEGVSSTDLEEVGTLQEHDLFPGFFVTFVEDEDDKKESSKEGVVLSVNNQDRTALVRWEKEVNSRESEETEVVPLYELVPDAEHRRIGDIVIRTDREKVRKDWVGEVIETGDQMKVQWLSGKVQNVKRDDIICVVNSTGDLDGMDSDDSDSDSDSDSSSVEGQGALSRAYKLYDRIRKFAAGEPITVNRQSGPQNNLISGSDQQGTSEAPTEKVNGEAQTIAKPHGANGNEQQEKVETADDQVETCEEDEPSDGPEPSFKVVDSMTRHKHANIDGALQPHAGFAQVVVKEWRRLSKHLPPNIFVRGCENRLDLLRAAIIGPAGTPYENVAFFFDIFLPGEYPNAPPKFHFWSHNRSLNPNLYPDGFVCLSILNTWKGKSVEVWNPTNSNLTRVLLSLQAMVFVERPFFNEPDYERFADTPDGQWKSNLYNESTTLLCLRHIMRSLGTGGAPLDFAAFVRRHYASVGPLILDRCRRLAQGDDKDEDVNLHKSVDETQEAKENRMKFPTVGFRLSVKRLIPKLEATFAKLAKARKENN